MSRPFVRPAFLLVILLLVSGIACLPVSAADDGSTATDRKTDSKAEKGKKARAKKSGRGLKDTDPSQAQAITREIKSRIKLYEKAFDEGGLETTYLFECNDEQEERKSLHWVFTTGEINRMLGKNFFRLVSLHGSTDGEPFRLGAQRLLLVAERA